MGVLVPILGVALLAHCEPCHGADSRIMQVLAIGEVDTSYCPLKDFCVSEPSLSVTLVVARDMHDTNYGTEGLKRLIRLYVPRTMESMLEYDFMLFNQPLILHFPPSSLEQMRSAIAEYGKGAMCFVESQYFDIYGPWLDTELSKCFPYDHYANLAVGHPSDEGYDLEVVKGNPNLPPLLTAYVPFGIEDVRPFGGSRPTYEKEGATIWAYCRSYGHGRYPLFISWRYGSGGGLVWATADQFEGPMWRSYDGK